MELSGWSLGFGVSVCLGFLGLLGLLRLLGFRVEEEQGRSRSRSRRSGGKKPQKWKQ